LRFERPAALPGQRQLLHAANYPFRPISDIRCRELVAPKRPVAQTPRAPKVAVDSG